MGMTQSQSQFVPVDGYSDPCNAFLEKYFIDSYRSTGFQFGLNPMKLDQINAMPSELQEKVFAGLNRAIIHVPRSFGCTKTYSSQAYMIKKLGEHSIFRKLTEIDQNIDQLDFEDHSNNTIHEYYTDIIIHSDGLRKTIRVDSC
jgi:hypothetical protein